MQSFFVFLHANNISETSRLPRLLHTVSGLEVTFPELIFNEHFHIAMWLRVLVLDEPVLEPCLGFFYLLTIWPLASYLTTGNHCFYQKNEVFNICVLDLKYFKIKLTSWVEPWLVQIVSQLQIRWLLLFLFIYSLFSKF